MAEITEDRVKEVLAAYTSIRKTNGSRYLKPQQDPNFPGWSASAVVKYQTLKRYIGFPLTVQSMTDVCEKIDASGKNLKRFYDDLHMFLTLMESQPDVNDLEGFTALRDMVKERYIARRDEDDKKVRKLTKQQEEAWLSWQEVMFRTQMCILYATITKGSLEQSYTHLATEDLEQYFICAFHVLEALPRRHEELSYLEWKKDEDEPRCNYIEDLITGKIVINRHKTSGYDPKRFSTVKMSLKSALPLLQELRSRATTDAKFVLPDCYRGSNKTAKYTQAFYKVTGRHISMNTLRHICATALTESNFNTRRNADEFIQYTMGHSVRTQSQYYVNQERLEDRHPEREEVHEDEESDDGNQDDEQKEEESDGQQSSASNDEQASTSSMADELVEGEAKPQEAERSAEVADDTEKTEVTADVVEPGIKTPAEPDHSVKDEGGTDVAQPEQPEAESEPTPVQRNKRSRYLPTPDEVATLVQLGIKWKPKLIKGERMSIQGLLIDPEIIAVNGKTAAQNLATFGGADISPDKRIEKLRNYVRTSEAFQPDEKLKCLKERVRAAAAKQQR